MVTDTGSFNFKYRIRFSNLIQMPSKLNNVPDETSFQSGQQLRLRRSSTIQCEVRRIDYIYYIWYDLIKIWCLISNSYYTTATVKNFKTLTLTLTDTDTDMITDYTWQDFTYKLYDYIIIWYMITVVLWTKTMIQLWSSMVHDLFTIYIFNIQNIHHESWIISIVSHLALQYGLCWTLWHFT